MSPKVAMISRQVAQSYGAFQGAMLEDVFAPFEFQK